MIIQTAVYAAAKVAIRSKAAPKKQCAYFVGTLDLIPTTLQDQLAVRNIGRRAKNLNPYETAAT